MQPKKYISPYIAGVALGLVLLGSFFVAGRGLGASGAMMRTVVAVEKAVVPSHVNNNSYLEKMGGGEKNPFDDWLVFEVLGVLVGGLVSGAISGRLKKETNRGSRLPISSAGFSPLSEADSSVSVPVWPVAVPAE